MNRKSVLEDGGSAAIEMALVAPVLMAMLLGIVSYGGYFLLAHNIQELASDAARAALPGLTADERQKLAQAQLAADIASYGILSKSAATASYAGDNTDYTVSISYDASGSAFWAAAGFIPMPSPLIIRSASIKLGGY